MKSKINLLEEAETRDEHEQENSERIAIIKRFLHFDEVCWPFCVIFFVGFVGALNLLLSRVQNFMFVKL